jgi:hypothetical protein
MWIDYKKPYPAMQWGLHLIFIFLIIIWVFGCSINKTRQEAVSEDYRGNVAGVPFKLNINKKASDNISEEYKMDVDWGSIISLAVSVLGGGGLGAIFMRNYKDGQIKEITDGVSEFINTKSSDVEKLLNALSKKMSNNTKKVVRRVKG